MSAARLASAAATIGYFHLGAVMECSTLEEARAEVVCVSIDQLEEHVQCLLGGRLRHFRIERHHGGLVLRGHAVTYYAKQLAQQAVMKATPLPIEANRIDVQ